MSDITVGNGTAGSFASVSATEYTATITPTLDGEVTVDVAAGVAQDVATNLNTAATQLTRLYDITGPTVVVSSTAADPINTSFDVTITFSEDVTGFELSDLDVGNGTASNLSGSGAVYTARITPTADGGVIVFISENVVQDAATNGNELSNEFFIDYDATNPTATMKTTAVSPINMPFTLDIVFDEAVFGFEESDLVVTNGATSSFTVSGTTYSVLISPTATADVTVDIPAGVAADLATNPNNAASFTIEYDNTPPNPPVITHISEFTCSTTVAITGDNTLEIFGTAERGSQVEFY